MPVVVVKATCRSTSRRDLSLDMPAVELGTRRRARMEPVWGRAPRGC